MSEEVLCYTGEYTIVVGRLLVHSGMNEGWRYAPEWNVAHANEF